MIAGLLRRAGLDARAAAIVMRSVRAAVDTGRTVVATIHQPSIDIFESFDDLLLMKVLRRAWQSRGQVRGAGGRGRLGRPGRSWSVQARRSTAAAQACANQSSSYPARATVVHEGRATLRSSGD
jgi:hypothetical protein